MRANSFSFNFVPSNTSKTVRFEFDLHARQQYYNTNTSYLARLIVRDRCNFDFFSAHDRLEIVRRVRTNGGEP